MTSQALLPSFGVWVSMYTNALEPIARKADRSASLSCILKKGVLPRNVSTAVKNSSPHMLGGKLPSLRRHLTVAASVLPTRSDTPFCCGVAVGVYSMLMPELTQSLELFGDVLASLVAPQSLDT